jgi:DNA-binding transcriptional LysR family regulator
VSLTPEGEIYHLRARDILAAIDDADAEISQAGQRPRGRLRVNSVPAFALNQLMAGPARFPRAYPEVELDFTVTDRVVDLLAENADVGIRSGHIQDTSLVARKIAVIRRGLYAAPSYLQLRGTPQRPEDLSDHDCVVLHLSRSAQRWPLRDRAEVRMLDIESRVLVDNGEAALKVAIAGGGIIRLADLIVAEAVRARKLRPVSTESHVSEAVPHSAVYPQGRQRMPKVRAFLELLVERFGHAPWRFTLTARA